MKLKVAWYDHFIWIYVDGCRYNQPFTSISKALESDEYKFFDELISNIPVVE